MDAFAHINIYLWNEKVKWDVLTVDGSYSHASEHKL